MAKGETVVAWREVDAVVGGHPLMELLEEMRGLGGDDEARTGRDEDGDADR